MNARNREAFPPGVSASRAAPGWARAFAWAAVALIVACRASEPPSSKAVASAASDRPRASAPAPAAGSASALPAAVAPRSTPLGTPQPAWLSRVRYAPEQVHSALTPGVRAALHGIAQRDESLHADRLLKVGDSITASGDYLACLSRGPIELAERVELAPIIERFARSKAHGLDVFARESLAARVGWSAHHVFFGRGLEAELHAVRARFAVVMFGTNDIETTSLRQFARNHWRILTYLTERGVIPIVFTVPARRDRRSDPADVSAVNGVVRALAEALRVPLVDYHLAMSSLPGAGLARDGVHPTVYTEAQLRRPCVFHARGLEHGFNLRNLLTLEALGRTVTALDHGGSSEASVEEMAAADVAPELFETGSWQAPYRLEGLPAFVARHGGGSELAPATGQEQQSQGDRHTPAPSAVASSPLPAALRVCARASAGAVFELRLERPAAVRVEATVPEGATPARVLLVDETDAGPTCVAPASAGRRLDTELSTGTHRFVVVTEEEAPRRLLFSVRARQN